MKCNYFTQSSVASQKRPAWIHDQSKSNKPTKCERNKASGIP